MSGMHPQYDQYGRPLHGHPDQPMHGQDAPQSLDPAAERVRRKLVRFMFVNLGILFGAVMIVMLAVVYRSGFFDSAPEATPVQPVAETPAAAIAVPPTGVVAPGDIVLPAGSTILSQSYSGDRLALHVALEPGREAIFIYDLAQGRMLGQLNIQDAQ